MALWARKAYNHCAIADFTKHEIPAYFAEYRKHHSVVEPDAEGRIVRRFPDGQKVILRNMCAQ